MSNTVINLAPDKKRQALARVREWAQSKGISPEKVSWSFLRRAVLMNPANSEYTFQLRKDTGDYLVHDRLLDLNDSFVIFAMGQRLLAENPALPGTGLLQTYPNNQVFPAAAGEVTPLHLNIFYNGSYQIKVDEVVYGPAIATDEMLVVRTTQQSSASTFSERFDMDGCVTMGTDITLNGSRKNEVTLKVPTFAGLQIQNVTAAARNYVVYYAYGFLISGGGNIGTL